MRTGKTWRRCVLGTAGVMLGGACVLFSQEMAQTGRASGVRGEGRLTGKGVRIPVEHDDEGRVKSQVYAGSATLPDTNGEVRAESVRMVLSESASGAKETVIVTDWCKLNISNRSARSTAPISVDQPGLSITGTGFRWNGEQETIKVVKDAHVVIIRSFMDQREGTSSAPTTLPGFRGKGY